MLYGDYHIHTTYSHGRQGIEENVRAAAAAGLKEIAVTDHGIRHLAFNLKRKYLPKIRREIDALKEKYPVNILFGVESNIISRSGEVDLKPEDREYLDIVLCGYHTSVRARFGNQFNLIGKNVIGQAFGFSKRLIAQNTRTYINVIKSGAVDVLTHINFKLKSDCAAVARAAADYGVYMEISGKRTGCSDEEIAAMAATGVNFIIDSDAHRAERVGDVKLALDIIARLGIPYSRVVNWDKKPVFKKDR